MVELRTKLRFALEAFEVSGFLRQFGGKNFDDDRAVEFRVERFINRSLSARADFSRILY